MSRFYKDLNSQNIFQELITLNAQSGALEMEEIKPNTTDAAQEKHVPVVSINDRIVEVSVGSVPHPMLEEHYITGIYIETSSGGQFKKLSPNDEPKAVFTLSEGDTFLAAYEYCNLHGLWKVEE